ncbi:MAG: hypothetical protein AB8B97_18650 [Granulosicoccus sp.]
MSDMKTKAITWKRAARRHQGAGHWHVERRSTVIICTACGERIPKWKNPQHCPACLAGKETG